MKEKKRFLWLWHGCRAVAKTEYVILVTFIAISVIGVVAFFADNIRALFATSANALAGQEEVQVETQTASGRSGETPGSGSAAVAGAASGAGEAGLVQRDVAEEPGEEEMTSEAGDPSDQQKAAAKISAMNRAALQGSSAASPKGSTQEGAGAAVPEVAQSSAITVGAEGSSDPIWKKSTVDISNLHQGLKDAYPSIVQVWNDNKAPTPVITSGNDSIHRGSNQKGTDCSTVEKCRQTSNSLHYKNRAIDLRANNVSAKDAQKLADDLQNKLGSDYDVVFEQFTKNPSNNHIHIEYNGK